MLTGAVSAIGLTATAAGFAAWLPSQTSRLSAAQIVAAAARSDIVLIDELVGHRVDTVCMVGGYEFMNVVAESAGIPYAGSTGFAAEIGENSIGLLAHGAGRTTYALYVPGWNPGNWGSGLFGANYRTRCFEGGGFALQFDGTDPPSGGRLILAATGGPPAAIALPQRSRWGSD